MGLQNNLEHNMIKLKKYQNQKLHKTGNKPTSNGFFEKWHLWEIFKKWQNNKCNAITEGQVISSVLASADKNHYIYLWKNGKQRRFWFDLKETK